MARPGRTQKQIAERYKTNLGYYNKIHPWRRARRLVSLLAIFGTVAGIWFFSKFGRETFFNSGPISSNHATIAKDCGACHERLSDPPRKVTDVLKDRFRHGVAFEPIDRKCETCHKQHSFHEANVVQNRSCSACHQEHQGSGPMKLVASSNCITCHGNSTTMAAAAEKGMQLPQGGFHRHPHQPQQVVFELPRPPRGYTETFASFADAHPEFQLIRDKARDPDVLRFNHQRHFAPDIPPVSGKALDCNYCHKPEPSGQLYQRITFTNNCQACHSLQFDPRNPELKIPHGDVQLVRTFLRTLPAQYADYARLKKGKSTDREVQSFVSEQIKSLRENFRSGDELEQAVFFTTDAYKPQRQMGAGTRARFSGCAFCHEVKAVAKSAPAITKPILMDRWMPQANFNHLKHQSVKCDDCHHASQSHDTSDVLMPIKANCVTCHSPTRKVTSECITCHTFHASPAAQTVIAQTESRNAGSVRQMLLGGAR
jgi:class III cytochrome C family protein